MKERNATMMIVLVVVALVITFGCDKKGEKLPVSRIEQKVETAKATKQSVIGYETLRRWTIPAGGVGMEILVAEEATKEEVLSLAVYIKSNFFPKGFLIIRIFDSKEAYLHRDDPDYPEKKYFKHFLVDVVCNPKTGYDKINWMAQGRDH